MPKLTGKIAFDELLERLIDAEKRAAANDLATDRAALAQLEKSSDAFVALYGAVDEAVRMLRAGHPTGGPVADRLVAAKTNAEKFINPIPF